MKSATVSDAPAAVAALAGPGTAAGPDDARTRDRVARALHDRGPQSAGALSASFGLTPAAVRRHLDALIAAGRVCEVPERKVRGQLRGRGRPAKLFALTDDGHSLFPHAYDDIAVEALTYLRAAGGDAAVSAFARQRLLMGLACAGVLMAAGAATLLPRTFLPPFNEGTLTINMLFNPGISLAESNRVGLIAEKLILGVPEVKAVGRRTVRSGSRKWPATRPTRRPSSARLARM